MLIHGGQRLDITVLRKGYGQNHVIEIITMPGLAGNPWLPLRGGVHDGVMRFTPICASIELRTVALSCSTHLITLLVVKISVAVYGRYPPAPVIQQPGGRIMLN